MSSWNEGSFEEGAGRYHRIVSLSTEWQGWNRGSGLLPCYDEYKI